MRITRMVAVVLLTALLLLSCGLSKKDFVQVKVINGCIIEYEGAEIESGDELDNSFTINKDCEVIMNE